MVEGRRRRNRHSNEKTSACARQIKHSEIGGRRLYHIANAQH